MTMTATHIINSLYGTYSLTDPGGVQLEARRNVPDNQGQPLPWGANGLVGMASRSRATICCGTRHGPVTVTIQVLGSRPSAAGIGDIWSDIVELDFRVVSGEVFLTNWDGEPVQPFLLESGNWRLRVHARGRDEGAARQWSGTDEDPVEEHLLQLFGGPLLGETAILTRDHYGQVLRAVTTPVPPPPQPPGPTIDEVLRNVLPNLPDRPPTS